MIWVDTDMGFDDILAVLTLRHLGLEVAGMSLSFGNAPLPQVRANAAGAAQAFGWRFPIHTGRAAPVLAPMQTAQTILGETGMRTAGLTLPEAPPLRDSPAFPALCAWLAAPGPHRLLALGPLTNIAALALARPDLAARITELTWMGGALTAGNHTASAEFNAWADPEALAIVLAHNLPLRMVDLDFCRRLLAAPEDVAPLRAAPGKNAALLADLLAGYVAIATSRGRPAMALYDPAAAFALTPAVAFRPARIEVELAGSLTRGRTVVDSRATAAPNAHFAAETDPQTARAAILGALLAEASR